MEDDCPLYRIIQIDRHVFIGRHLDTLSIVCSMVLERFDFDKPGTPSPPDLEMQMQNVFLGLPRTCLFYMEA